MGIHLLVFSSPYLIGLASFTLCILFTPCVIRLARYKNWVVAPRVDRWHQEPTALMGGIAIFLSYSIAVLFSTIEGANTAVYLASLIMFLVGLFDDFKSIKPVIKLFAQVICAFILLYCGFNFGGGLLGWAGIPLTFFWVIGITNAINLLDNMDGLSAGISTIIAIISGILGIANGDNAIASMAFALAGASAGFLLYNFKPAKIFMGDSGSLFLGFSLCFLSISVQGKLGSSSAVLMLLVPISLMAIPIMDTTLVTIKRIVAGRRIDQGGKDHTSHRLVALGLTERKAVIILYAISAVWGVLCILMYKTQINNLLLCVLLLTIFSGFFSIVLSKVKVYNESEEKLAYLRYRGQKSGDNLLLRFFLFHKKLISGIFIDISIIYCSFLIAVESMHNIHGEDYFTLGLFIFVKMSLFYLFNLYYRMWRYMAIMELSGYFIATILATLILAVVIFFQGKVGTYSLFFFLMDFLLTFTGVIFTRLIYRWLIELFQASEQYNRRVVIYGAGDGGYLLIKELMHNKSHKLKPVAWIDDDISKHNMYLYGFKVYGGIDMLEEVCRIKKADMVVVSTNYINDTNEILLRKIAEAEKIELGRFSVSLHYEPVQIN